jgi:Tfp pilus assembly protein PilN
MRPVNLLPDDLRPRQASGALRGSSYAVVGVLGTLFLMVVVYVLSANSVNGHKTDIAEAQQETQEAEARASALAPYQQFAQIKDTRVASVTALASQRFDWERTMREIALVLPAGTSVTELNATTAGAATPGAAAPAPADPTQAAATAGAGPTLQLKGCAERQPDVATLMVRLRGLYRSSDVNLTESTKQTQAAAGGAPPAASSDSAAGTGDGCPSDAYQFDMNVAFTPTDPGEKQKLQAPARLGGGA